MANGNTFDARTYNFNHSRKVWREVEKVEPAGGTISNISDWVTKGIIPTGTAVKFDRVAKTIVAYTDTAITGAADVTTLGINGFLLNDIVVRDANTVGWGDVVYRGAIYDYMFEDAVLAKLVTLTTIGGIHFVR